MQPVLACRGPRRGQGGILAVGTSVAKPHFVPALKSSIGDWDYYIAQLTMADVAKLVKLAKEIHTSESLNDMIQRSLSDRADAIKSYLLNREDRFLNALVIGVYGGSPQWYSLDVRSNELLDADTVLPRQVEDAVGFLLFNGEERLFAIDGQHRVLGIRKALKENSSLANENVTAIFVGHSNTPAGLIRTRRLFTTLNRYAKPVNKRDKIALDEDDVVAIVTRRLLDEHPLFHDKVAAVATNNLKSRDTSNITTLGALYDAMNEWLRDRSVPKWSKLKRFRPEDPIVDSFMERASIFWDGLCSIDETLQAFRDAKPAPELAAEARNQVNGGHVVFRPIGLILIAKLAKALSLSLEFSDVLSKLSLLAMNLGEYPWDGLIWDGRNKRMRTESANRIAAERLAYYSLCGDLSPYRRYNVSKLRNEVAGILNVEPEDVELRSLE